MDGARERVVRMNCSICNTETELAGLFRVEDPSLNAPGPICFGCVYVQCLKGATCVNCGASNVVGFVSFWDTETNRLAPVAICPVCIQGGDPVDEVLISTSREIIPEIGDQ